MRAYKSAFQINDECWRQPAEPMADRAKLLGLTGRTLNWVVLLASHEVLLQSIRQLDSVVDVQMQHPARLWISQRLGDVATATNKEFLDRVLEHTAQDTLQASQRL